MLFGARKALNPLMYHMHKEFKLIRNITKLDLGIAYPRIRCFNSCGGIKPEDILCKEVEVLNAWDSINEVYFIGLSLTSKLKHWFGALRQPLQIVNLHACYLNSEDFSYLAQSHHVPAMIEFGLDKNNLAGTADALSDVLRNAKNLKMFSAVDTQLSEGEIADLVAACQGAENLHSFNIYEQENHLTSDGYANIVELVCAVRPMRGFYVFPFNYKPFDKVYKPSVLARCEYILELNNRTDIKLGF